MKRATAQWDFTPQANGQLRLQQGELVEILSSANEDWWLVKISTNVGYVPASYLSVMPMDDSRVTAHDSVGRQSQPYPQPQQRHSPVSLHAQQPLLQTGVQGQQALREPQPKEEEPVAMARLPPQQQQVSPRSTSSGPPATGRRQGTTAEQGDMLPRTASVDAAKVMVGLDISSDASIASGQYGRVSPSDEMVCEPFDTVKAAAGESVASFATTVETSMLEVEHDSVGASPPALSSRLGSVSDLASFGSVASFGSDLSSLGNA